MVVGYRGAEPSVMRHLLLGASRRVHEFSPRNLLVLPGKEATSLLKARCFQRLDQTQIKD